MVYGSVQGFLAANNGKKTIFIRTERVMIRIQGFRVLPRVAQLIHLHSSIDQHMGKETSIFSRTDDDSGHQQRGE